MDMISQLEMKDGLAAFLKLQARLHEIAVYITQLDGFLGSQDPKYWSITRCHVGQTGREDQEPTTSVTLLLSGTAGSRLLKELGHPDWEEYEDSNNQGYNPTRTVYFPTRYIYTDGWEGEVEAKANASKLWWAERKVEDLTKAIEKSRTNHVRLIRDLKAAMTERDKLRGGQGA